MSESKYDRAFFTIYTSGSNFDNLVEIITFSACLVLAFAGALPAWLTVLVIAVVVGNETGAVSV